MVRPLPPVERQQTPDLGQAGPVISAALTDYGVMATQDERARHSATSLRRMNVQYRYSPIKSHHSCMRNGIPNRKIVYDGDGISGLQLCSSSTCQCCATKKHIQTAEVLANIINNTAKSYSYGLLTLTIPTARSIFSQVDIIKSSYKTWIKSVRKMAKRAGEDVAVSWAFDATFDTSTGKHHLHKHAIVRVNKTTSIDWEQRLFDLWKLSVRRHGGGEVSKNAYYFEEVRTSGQAAKYLFKAAKEALVNQSKSSPVLSNRVGFNALADAILVSTEDKLDMLVKMYRDFISAVKGRKWFFIANKMKQDYVEPTEEDEELATMTSVEEEVRIKPMIVSPHFHRALCDSGYLWLLSLVLRMKKDGDIEVDTLRYLVEKYSLYEDVYWLSEHNYKSCIEEVSLWGQDFE